MNKYKRPFIALTCVLLAFCMQACDAYLDAKPDKKMAEPHSLDDCDELMDNNNEMNLRFPAAGEAATDDYYLSQANWESLTVNEDRLNYLWDAGYTAALSQWQQPYKAVMLANQVLDILPQLNRAADPIRFDRIRGTALFFRGYAFFYLAQLFAPPYEGTNTEQQPGIPLRLDPATDYPSVQASLAATYRQIVQDLSEAAHLLPVQVTVKTRPCKAAAYGTLARTYLCMQSYEKAGHMADSALADASTLLNYDKLDAASAAPFARFNAEVIFHATTGGNSALNASKAYIDTSLYDSYDEHDLRKQLFFKTNIDGSHAFKGKYDGQNNSSPFSGLCTDELYLIGAEAMARQGQVQAALTALNTLMKTRWDAAFFVPFTASSAEDALDLILVERRKELLYRNLRWTDLRRLNSEPRYAHTLLRKLNGQQYQLPPNDPRYTLLIPREVILNSTLTQNPR